MPVRKDNSLFILFRILKWCVKAVLVITGILPLARCGSGYRESNGKVTFNGEEITDKSFVVLNDVFGKSDSAAYYKRYDVPGADIATFTALDQHYAKDRQTVYYCDEEREGQNYYLTKHSVILKIKGADAPSFTVLDGSYAKDNARAYAKGVGFDVKDAASLSVIDGRFLKDRYQVYFEYAPVKGADPVSFRTLSNWYARDTERVYYFGDHSDLYNGIHPIPCDPSSFTMLEYPYSKDAGSVYYLYMKIPGADPATFSILGNGFSKDRERVYSAGKLLPGADATTFTTFSSDSSLEEVNYSKDKEQVFWKNKRFTVTNLAAFHPLGLDYATDGRQVYYGATLVKSADPATFKVYDHGYGDADAEDARERYLKGVKLPEEKPVSDHVH